MNESMLSLFQLLFLENEFRVVNNQPFKGGYITQHYGKVNQSCEAIQIELSYHAYIDQRDFVEEE